MYYEITCERIGDSYKVALLTGKTMMRLLVVTDVTMFDASQRGIRQIANWAKSAGMRRSGIKTWEKLTQLATTAGAPITVVRWEEGEGYD